MSAVDAATTGSVKRQLSLAPPPPKEVVLPKVISSLQTTRSAVCVYRAEMVALPNDGVLTPVLVDHSGTQVAHTGLISLSRAAVIRSPAAQGLNATVPSYCVMMAGRKRRTSPPAACALTTPFCDRTTLQSCGLRIRKLSYQNSGLTFVLPPKAEQETPTMPVSIVELVNVSSICHSSSAMERLPSQIRPRRR